MVNTQFSALNINVVLDYILGADPKNEIGFFLSALALATAFSNSLLLLHITATSTKLIFSS